MSAKTSRDRSARASSVSGGNDAREAAPSHRPARGYSWPPFERGNTAAMRHGANSARMVRPVAERIKAGLLATEGLEYLRAPRFAAVLDEYARAAARAQLVDAWIAGMDWATATDGRDGRTPPLELSRLLSRRADLLGDRLGLAPVIDDDVRAEIKAANETIARHSSGGTRKENQWLM